MTMQGGEGLRPGTSDEVLNFHKAVKCDECDKFGRER
jgi:hypothetical protein